MYLGVVMAKPPALRPGDVVRVIAPASSFDRESFDQGLKLISERYKPRFDEGIFKKARYLAGDDEHRFRQLEQAFLERETKAVFCARGGYGATRLLHRVDFAKWPLKALAGFSDITSLHAASQAAGRVSLHGPVVTQLGKLEKKYADRTFEALESTKPLPRLEGARPLVSGTAEGMLLGGNLSVFTRLLGTPYLPPLDDAILLVEDVGERPYRLDRMWTHLKLAGVLKRISGLVLGEFVGCEEKDGDHTSLEVLESLARETGLPCAHGFPIGHGDRNSAVPLGIRVRLDATSGTLDFLEAGAA